MKAVVGAVTYSRANPSAPSPGTSPITARSGSPSIQCGKKVDTTLSPTANSLTPSPTSITSPAPSDMGTRPSGVGIIPVTTA